jgi:hypothetical protein
MMEIALLLTAASTGVDYGWQRTEDGALEYIIQVEPALLEALAAGEPIISEIHPDARGVRRFRILVGNAQLPREGLPIAPTAVAPLPGPMPTFPADAGAFETAPRETRVPAANRLNDSLQWSLPPDDARSAAAPVVQPPLMQPPLVQPPVAQPPFVAPPVAGSMPPGGPSAAVKDEGSFPALISPAEPSPPRIRPIVDADRNSPAPVVEQRYGDEQRYGNEQRSPAPPRAFYPELSRDPLVKPASGSSAPTNLANDQLTGTVDTATTKASDTKPPSSATQSEAAPSGDAPRPWLPLALTALLLFASLGANAWLGLIARGFYLRYRALTDDLRSGAAPEAA